MLCEYTCEFSTNVQTNGHPEYDKLGPVIHCLKSFSVWFHVHFDITYNGIYNIGHTQCIPIQGISSH